MDRIIRMVDTRFYILYVILLFIMLGDILFFYIVVFLLLFFSRCASMLVCALLVYCSARLRESLLGDAQGP